MGGNHGNGYSFRRWAGGLALAVLSLMAQAQSVTTTAYDRFMATATGATQTTVTYGSNGTPVAAPSSMTLTPDGGSGTATSQTGTIRNPAGNPANITANGRIPNASIAGAVGRFAMKSFMITSTAMAFMDLLNEIGWALSEDPVTGGSTYGQSHALPEPVWGFNHNDGSATIYRKDAAGWDAVCAMYYSGSVSAPGIGSNSCRYSGGNTWAGNIPSAMHACFRGDGVRLWTPQWSGGPMSTPCTDPYMEPRTIEELQNLIASRSGWPSTSKVAAAAKQAAEATDTRFAPQNPTVTGPAQTQGRKATTTSANPDGSTRTESTDCKWNHTYSGAVITSTEACTTTTTNDGTVGNTTTKTQTSEGASPQKTEPTPDPCDANPDRVGCLKLGDVPTEEIPRETRELTYAVEDLGFGGGACPAPFAWSDSLGSHALDLTDYCAILQSVVRPIVLAMTALTCLFILMPGKTEA